MKALKLWLKSDRDYFVGLSLLIDVCNNKELLAVLRRGDTDFNKKRLLEEIKSFTSEERKIETIPTPTPAKLSEKIIDINIKEDSPAVNPKMYEAAREEAMKVYKEAMNIRAELFALTRCEPWEVNKPDIIEKRRPLAISALTKYKQASALFDKADHIKTTGRIPNSEVVEDENMNSIPDHLVKQKLDNLRKNYNKMKTREQTPERIQLMQKHEANIKLLEERWHSLK